MYATKFPTLPEEKTLLTHGRLRSLNLSTNGLRAFDPPDFGRIESLDLSYNELSDWPRHLLDAQDLRVLNVSGNEFMDLPPDLLDGSHETLVAGMDLSDNEDLSLPSSERTGGPSRRR